MHKFLSLIRKTQDYLTVKVMNLTNLQSGNNNPTEALKIEINAAISLYSVNISDIINI